MVFRHTEMLVLLLTAQLACFRAPTEPDGTTAAPLTLGELALRDPQGARYPPTAAPRDLALVFPDAIDRARIPPLLLVRGTLSEAFARRLPAGRTPARIAAMAIALAPLTQDAVLTLRPSAPLEAGAAYTLLWLAPDRPAAFGFTVSRSPSLGAQLAESLPGDGETRVPTNLARALVRFDGYVAGDLDTRLALRDGAGQPHPSAHERIDCAALGLPAGTCVWLTPAAPLPPRSGFSLALDGATLSTETGAPLASQTRSFASGPGIDAEPPMLLATRCAADERALGPLCALTTDDRVDIRGTLSEPALITAVSSLARHAAIVHGRDFTLFDLARGPDRALHLRVVDLAGNVHEQALSLPDQSPLARVSIDEVRADPHGKEPAQEYVELLNFGEQPVSLMGFSLSTDKTRAHTFGATDALAPGQRVLVVGPDFDPTDTSDGALPDGVRLVRLATSLGLANAGVALYLRDQRGQRLSAAPALAPLLEGQCSARRGDDPRSGQPAAFALDPDGACTPGRPSFPPP